MLLYERRTLLPFSKAELQIGELFMLASSTKEVQVGEVSSFSFNGIEIGHAIKQTHLYSLRSTLSCLFSPIPAHVLELKEETILAFPYKNTVTTNPGFMNQHFIIEIQTIYCEDQGDEENIFNLTPSELAVRKKKTIDPLKDSKIKQALVNNDAFMRLPLDNDWKNTTPYVVTAYQLIKVKFEWRFVTSVMEHFIQKKVIKMLNRYINTLLTSSEIWLKFTRSSIRLLEIDSQVVLNEASSPQDFSTLFVSYSTFGSRGNRQISVFNAVKWFRQSPISNLFGMLEKDFESKFIAVAEGQRFMHQRKFTDDFLTQIANLLSRNDQMVVKEDIVMFLVRAGPPKFVSGEVDPDDVEGDDDHDE